MSSSKMVSNVMKHTDTYRIALVGAGQMFGEEDVLAERPYQTTVTCKSNTAECFVIKHDEFFRKLKTNTESWKMIIMLSMEKEKAFFKRVAKIRQIVADKAARGVKNLHGGSVFKDNLLLNQNELDLRETLREIVNEYPYVKQHKKMIENVAGETESRPFSRIPSAGELKSHGQVEQETEEKAEKLAKQKSKKTIEMNFNEIKSRDQSPQPTKGEIRVTSGLHTKRSPSKGSTDRGASSKYYINSKITNILATMGAGSVESEGDTWRLHKQPSEQMLKNTASNVSQSLTVSGALGQTSSYSKLKDNNLSF